MPRDLSVQEAFEMIRTAKAYGIDVREADEWSAGRAIDVTWNPLSNFSLENLPTDKPVIFICRSGSR
jgi:rhodanese-related sulfurtransferase